MAPSLRPLPRPERHSSHPVRSSRKHVNSYREDSSDEAAALSTFDEADEYTSTGSDEANRHSRRYGNHHSPVTRRPQMPVDESLDGANSLMALSNGSHKNSNGSVHNTTASNSSSVKSRVTRASSSHAKRSLFLKSSPRFNYTSNSKKKNKISSTKRMKFADNSDALCQVDHGAIPPWQILPYHVLLDIFSLSSTLPSAQTVPEVTRSIRWLLSIAYLCRSFYEPAIAVLYYSPPLYPHSRMVSLTNLLSLPDSAHFVNYRNKVKKIEIDLRHHPLRHMDVCKLIAHTPRLRHLWVHYGQEYSTGPTLGGSGLAWLSWEKLFDTLDKYNIHLHSWEWNGDLFGVSQPSNFSKLAPVHLRPAFRNLQSVYFLNVFPPRKHTGRAHDSEEELEDLEKDVVSSLAALPHLSQLSFRNCCFVKESFLSQLPTNLCALSLVDCGGVTSSSLDRFLESHGHNLRELILSHNRNLNLSFAKDLAQLCPKLEVFKMDLTFTSPSYHRYDVEPYFSKLLDASEVPTWPTTLRSLELERLRKWDMSTATIVFNSLIESAPHLPDLRRLVVTATLDVGWRDRAVFRKECARRLEKVFLRKPSVPNFDHFSLPPPPPQKHQQEASQNGSTNGLDGNNTSGKAPVLSPEQPSVPFTSTSSSSPPPKRHSARIAEQKLAESSSGGDDENDEGHITKGKGKNRNYNDDDDDSHRRQDGYRHDMMQSTDKQKGLGFVHGLCDVVEIRIDNMRPTDHLLTADDFEDSEVSGDEDWSGRDLEPNEQYAW